MATTKKQTTKKTTKAVKASAKPAASTKPAPGTAAEAKAKRAAEAKAAPADATANDRWRIVTQLARKAGFVRDAGAGFRAALVAFAEKHGIAVPERRAVQSLEAVQARFAVAAGPAPKAKKSTSVRAPKPARRSAKVAR